eukprot:2364757-Pyramimonas_sp.AAC.1
MIMIGRPRAVYGPTRNCKECRNSDSLDTTYTPLSRTHRCLFSLKMAALSLSPSGSLFAQRHAAAARGVRNSALSRYVGWSCRAVAQF